MATDYHRSVQSHLLAIGEVSRNIRRVFNDKRPRHIFHPITGESFRYFPDATFVTSTERFYIFEVLDSEEHAQSQIVAHVLEAFLTPGVLKAIFVVKTNGTARIVARMVKVIIANLEDLSKGGLNKSVRFYQVVISESDARSYRKVRSILTEARRDLGLVLKA